MCDQIYEQLRFQFPCTERHEARVKRIISENFDASQSLNRNNVSESIRLVKNDLCDQDWSIGRFMFQSIFIYMSFRHNLHLRCKSISSLLDVYPEFSHMDELEQKRLLNFRNMCVVASLCFDPREDGFISLVLSSCDAAWPNNNGQTEATNRRILIFERETKLYVRGSLPIPTIPPNANIREEPDESRAVKRSRISNTNQKAVARAGLVKAFWLKHILEMEAGTDIPSVDAPPNHTFPSVPYQAHDLPRVRYKTALNVVHACQAHWSDPILPTHHPSPSTTAPPPALTPGAPLLPPPYPHIFLPYTLLQYSHEPYNYTAQTVQYRMPENPPRPQQRTSVVSPTSTVAAPVASHGSDLLA